MVDGVICIQKINCQILCALRLSIASMIYDSANAYLLRHGRSLDQQSVPALKYILQLRQVKGCNPNTNAMVRAEVGSCIARHRADS